MAAISPASRQQDHGTDAALGPIPGPDRPVRSDAAGGTWWALYIQSRAVFDAAEDSPLASSQFVGDA